MILDIALDTKDCQKLDLARHLLCIARSYCSGAECLRCGENYLRRRCMLKGKTPDQISLDERGDTEAAWLIVTTSNASLLLKDRLEG